jgi:hypothetical protein
MTEDELLLLEKEWKQEEQEIFSFWSKEINQREMINGSSRFQ